MRRYRLENSPSVWMLVEKKSSFQSDVKPLYRATTGLRPIGGRVPPVPGAIATRSVGRAAKKTTQHKESSRDPGG